MTYKQRNNRNMRAHFIGKGTSDLRVHFAFTKNVKQILNSSLVAFLGNDDNLQDYTASILLKFDLSDEDILTGTFFVD